MLDTGQIPSTMPSVSNHDQAGLSSESGGRLGNCQIMLELLSKEYATLKDEQLKRIIFRDNMVYVLLVVTGAVLSIAVGRLRSPQILLIMPWASFVLGWTYLVNDEKISAIGRYLRRELRPKLKELTGGEGEAVLGWELVHRSDSRRVERKVIQLLVDEATFVLPGLVTVRTYLAIAPPTAPTALLLVASAELALMLALAFQIARYADFTKGR